ncbi:uncharacterized protein LOC128954612 [Oppia nitens]|uniref:uncharacterized protein LOC128954612 n=1 Tax=Oppia nitens TaxID=1686743 RepID=UPI0023D9AF42|nr:uncharacterized protein LOC128954612 [Oppia nitens]
MNDRIFLLLLTLIIALFNAVNGETCQTTVTINGNENVTEVFDCPRLFESKTMRFCCRLTSLEKHCCDWDKRSKEFGPKDRQQRKNGTKNSDIKLIAINYLVCLLIILYFN